MPSSLNKLDGASRDDLGRILALLGGTEHVQRESSSTIGGGGGGKKKGRERGGGVGNKNKGGVELQRSDIGYFGNYGSSFGEEDEGASPFQYFFK